MPLRFQVVGLPLTNMGLAIPIKYRYVVTPVVCLHDDGSNVEALSNGHKSPIASSLQQKPCTLGVYR